jgi:hypothetical protein
LEKDPNEVPDGAIQRGERRLRPADLFDAIARETLAAHFDELEYARAAVKAPIDASALLR